MKLPPTGAYSTPSAALTPWEPPALPDSIRNLLKNAVTDLTASDSARLDAELLLSHCLTVGRAYLYAHPEKTVENDALTQFFALLERRIQGEPLAYLLGEKEFWSLSLRVNAATLVPRPETELLVSLAIAHSSPSPRILELGTGSGAISIALASELPDAQITASEFSAEALAVASDNAQRHQLANVSFTKSASRDDWFSAIEARQFDLLISNPPYVADIDPGFESGSIRFEPRTALAAGPDGLDDLKKIIAGAPDFLVQGGFLILEHGAQQAAAVTKLMADSGFTDIDTNKDLAGMDRATLGRYVPDR